MEGWSGWWGDGCYGFSSRGAGVRRGAVGEERASYGGVEQEAQVVLPERVLRYQTCGREVGAGERVW